MFQVKADDARVMPVKRQSAPKHVRPVQGQGGHPRSVQRAPATSNSRALGQHYFAGVKRPQGAPSLGPGMTKAR